MTPESTQSPISPQLRFLLGFASLVVIVWGLKEIAPILNTVLLALVLAQAIAPAVEWLVERRVRPGLAVTAIVALVLVLLLSVSAGVGRSVAGLTDSLPQYEAGLFELRDRLLAQLASWGVDTAHISANDLLSPGKAVGFVTGVVKWVASAFGNLFLIVFLAAIMLAHMAELHLDDDGAPTEGASFMARVSSLSVDVRPYVRITAATGLLFSLIITGVLFALQVPYAPIWGVLAFFFNFLPQVGIILSWLPPAVIAMVTMGWGTAFTVIAAYTVINFVVDNIVKPRMMATGLEISFLAIILSLVFWGWVLGPAGAILSVPLTLAVRRFMNEFHTATPPAPAAVAPSGASTT